MNTFTWLLIGHLIGDWMWQSSWMAQGKQRGCFTIATVVHCIMYTLATVIFLWIAQVNGHRVPSYVLFAALIGVTHWLIDGLDVAGYWMRHVQQCNQRFVRIVVDQTLHLLVLALLVALPA